MATIYFDLDGTLVDCRERHYSLYAEICGGLGIRPLSGRRYWSLRRQGASSPSLVPETAKQVRAEFARRWLEQIESPAYVALDQPFPGVLRALKRLQEAHRLVLVTLRQREEVLLRQLEDLGLSEHLGAVVCPNGRPLKSKADLVDKRAARRDRFVVGDSEADVALARELGAPAICVLSGVRGRKYLEGAGADHMIRSVSTLPRLMHNLAG